MSKKPDLVLEETRLFTIYLHELWWLAHSIKQKTDRLFSETRVPENGYLLQVNPDLHSLISSVLSDAAILKNFVHTPSGKKKDESGRQYRLRLARGAMLKSLIVDAKVSEILNPKVRNTLEHFDEYLDCSNIDITESNDPDLGFVAYNLIISNWDVFGSRCYPVRLYVTSEKKFYNMRWDVDIGKMNEEADAIVKAITKKLGGPMEEPGALLLRLR